HRGDDCVRCAARSRHDLSPCAVACPVGTMKAAVLARGLGRRMRERDPDAILSNAQAAAATAGAKAMMPIAADDRSAPRPFLDYVLASLADAGMTEVAL